MKYLLNINQIEKDFETVKKNYDSINKKLKTQRDVFDDNIMQNMLEVYEYVNFLLQNDQEIFHKHGYKHMLELNHRALLGVNQETRIEYGKHIEHTEEKFYRNISKVEQYVNHKSIYKAAAGVFVSGVSQPQLFIEGNHRTNTTMVNYMLLQKGKAPFILNIDNAIAFFDPAQEIKGTIKGTLKASLKLLKHKKAFKDFFKYYADAKYMKKSSSGKN